MGGAVNHLRQQWRQAAANKVWVDCPRCGGTGRYSGGVCFRCEGAKGEWVSAESIERAKERAEERRQEREEREERLRSHVDKAQAEFAERYPDHWTWVVQEHTERATGALGFIQSGDYEQAARLIEQVSGWSFAAKTAMPQSWRPVTERWWPYGHDVVVMTDVRRRRRHYEVYVLGQYIGGRERLDDAKRLAEDYAGFALDWVQEAAPPQEVTHYFFGPTVEFTEPVTYYRASLPQFIVSSLSR